MPNQYAMKKRLAELREEVERKTADFEAGRIADKNYYRKFIDRASVESEELRSDLKSFEQAGKFSGGTEAATGGQVMSPNFPGSSGELVNPHLQSPLMVTPDQIQQLEYAMKAKTPCTI